MRCDPETGACLLPDPQVADIEAKAPEAAAAVHYVGDPMCSWCWGLSPAVAAIEAFCQEAGIEFSVTVGGLRAGGGDRWDAGFRQFLRDEWRQIAAVTGQPFGYTLLEAADFNYDTEPACRAVATFQMMQAGQPLQGATTLQFFSAVQRKFYVEGADPKVAEFYGTICAELDLDFEAFRSLFASPEARQAVLHLFQQARIWGVRSFPTVLLERNGAMTPLITGYVSEAEALRRLTQALDAGSE